LRNPPISVGFLFTQSRKSIFIAYCLLSHGYFFPVPLAMLYASMSKLGHTILRYGVAVLAVGLTIPIKISLIVPEFHEREAPFILSLAAVMVSGWYGGLGPGLFATALAALTGDYFFMKPYLDIGLISRIQWIRFGMFTLEGTLISVLCHTLKTATRRAEVNARETQKLQRELLEITDSEQRRIGHDLHDGLGQHLTGIAFMSKLIEQRLTARRIPEATDAANIAGLVNKAIGWTRDLARGLAPVELEREDGLASALQKLTQSTAEMFGANCQFELDGVNGRVRDPIAAGHLYRIAQEGMNNAIKHAHAKSIVVRLTQKPREATIAIEDDGTGFDPEQIRTGGMGLRIMRYRAKMISGSFEIKKPLSGGTIITCTCPLPEPVKEIAHAPASQDHYAAPHRRESQSPARG